MLPTPWANAVTMHEVARRISTTTTVRSLTSYKCISSGLRQTSIFFPFALESLSAGGAFLFEDFSGGLKAILDYWKFLHLGFQSLASNIDKEGRSRFRIFNG